MNLLVLCDTNYCLIIKMFRIVSELTTFCFDL